MKKDDRVYLQHVVEAIGRIQDYLTEVSKEQFLQTSLLQDAVIRRLEIIGEASRNLSEEFRNRYPQVPWAHIVGLRNRIVHEYFGVDLEIVWEIVQYDLPLLKEQIENIAEAEGWKGVR